MPKLRKSMLLGCIAVFAMGVTVQADSITYDFNTAGDVGTYFTHQVGTGNIVYTESASGGINDSGCVLVNQQSNREALYEKTAFPVSQTTWQQILFFQVKDDTVTSSGVEPVIGFGVAASSASLPSYVNGGNAHLSVGIEPRSSDVHRWRLGVFCNDGTTFSYYDSGTNVTVSDGWYRLNFTFTENQDGTFGFAAYWNISDSSGGIGALIQSVTGTTAALPWLTADPNDAHAFVFSRTSANLHGIERFDNFTTATPEPTTIALLSLGAVGLPRRRRG
ncbi:MAG: PEP-CTERM sorting domain-containing protein [Phycisphaerae bacterium]|nr:PEP-CTERM sorting domain-containing protein [Phycisphaerae bacterium]